jgi:hypothetical protein
MRSHNGGIMATTRSSNLTPENVHAALGLLTGSPPSEEALPAIQSFFATSATAQVSLLHFLAAELSTMAEGVSVNGVSEVGQAGEPAAGAWEQVPGQTLDFPIQSPADMARHR